MRGYLYSFNVKKKLFKHQTNSNMFITECVFWRRIWLLVRRKRQQSIRNYIKISRSHCFPIFSKSWVVVTETKWPTKPKYLLYFRKSFSYWIYNCK